MPREQKRLQGTVIQMPTLSQKQLADGLAAISNRGNRRKENYRNAVSTADRHERIAPLERVILGAMADILDVTYLLRSEAQGIEVRQKQKAPRVDQTRGARKDPPAGLPVQASAYTKTPAHRPEVIS